MNKILTALLILVGVLISALATICIIVPVKVLAWCGIEHRFVYVLFAPDMAHDNADDLRRRAVLALVFGLVAVTVGGWRYWSARAVHHDNCNVPPIA